MSANIYASPLRTTSCATPFAPMIKRSINIDFELLDEIARKLDFNDGYSTPRKEKGDLIAPDAPKKVRSNRDFHPKVCKTLSF